MTVPAYLRSGPAAAVSAPQQPSPFKTSSVPRFAEVGAPQRWNRLATSLFLHTSAILFLIKLVALIPAATQLETRTHESVMLIAPSLDKPEPLPAPKISARLRETPKLPEPVPVLNPKIEAPKLKPPQQLPPEAPRILAKASIPEMPKPLVPRKIVEGAFDSGSSATPTVHAQAHDVQTGGFGDSNGVSGKSNNERKLTVAAAGSFDLPSGSGNGNGDAGSRGQRAVIASSGFGNGVAGSGSGSGRPRSVVGTGGFGDASVVQVAARRAVEPLTTPVAILSKPRPVYTAEARELHIEGEVLLAVMFAASGDVRVLRVVRGLGHGLDEAAESAGQKIRFEPAKRDGHPYDSDAVVHIVFQLAE
jgi:TonB family protein